MKKFPLFWVVITVVTTMVGLSAEAYDHKGSWILCDDFNSGVIDTNRWIIDSSSTVISIEGERAKFVHISGKPMDSAWLGIKIAPETVRGIKAKVTVESCTTPFTDVRARMGGFIGMMDDDYVHNQLGLEGGISSPRIFGGVAGLGGPPYFPFLYDILYAHFIRPVDIIGHTFTISMTFPRDEFTYTVSGLGKLTYEFLEELSPTTDQHFKGIGTRSENGLGSCVVYFDDVYVLR